MYVHFISNFTYSLVTFTLQRTDFDYKSKKLLIPTNLIIFIILCLKI